MTPISEEDIARSVVFSSRYVSPETLQRISDEMIHGGPWPEISPGDLENARRIACKWMASPNYPIAVDMASRAGTRNSNAAAESAGRSFSIFHTGFIAVAVIGVTALSAVQLYAGALGLHQYLGTGWTIAIIFLVFVTRFTIPLAVGTFICATQIWGLHWAWGVLLAAPGIALAIPTFFVAIAEKVGAPGRYRS